MPAACGTLAHAERGSWKWEGEGEGADGSSVDALLMAGMEGAGWVWHYWSHSMLSCDAHYLVYY